MGSVFTFNVSRKVSVLATQANLKHVVRVKIMYKLNYDAVSVQFYEVSDLIA